VVEDYIVWLTEVYSRATGVALNAPNLIHEGVGILRRHGSRWPGEEDFVPLVATEMAERLHDAQCGNQGAQPISSFLDMLERVADTVRHRIARAARKRMSRPSTDVLEQVAARVDPREEALRALAEELAVTFTIEEQTVLSLYLAGESIQQIAKDLKLSARTVYRRLEEIKQGVARRAKTEG
jgi:DNA-directed RNA polymerase specialized sigma24 family protein